MAYAVTIDKCGGSEQLKVSDITIPAPAEGEVTLHHETVGLNFIDVYFRTGLYPINSFPATVGMEAAGTVTAVGKDVSNLSEGDRVAYACAPIGAYASDRTMRASSLVKLPDTISFEQAAAMMLQGMTVQYLIRQTYRVEAGDTVLFHAAAGGVGLIACQWLKHLGATVIGTVGSDEKAELARAHGCDQTILYDKENVAERVKELTDGKGVNASGPVTDFNFGTLAAKGSLYVTRPTLMTYIADPANMQSMADDLFDVVTSGKVKISINQRYALSDAAQAHDALEARKTTGSTIFTT